MEAEKQSRWHRLGRKLQQRLGNAARRWRGHLQLASLVAAGSLSALAGCAGPQSSNWQQVGKLPSQLPSQLAMAETTDPPMIVRTQSPGGFTTPNSQFGPPAANNQFGTNNQFNTQFGNGVSNGPIDQATPGISGQLRTPMPVSGQVQQPRFAQAPGGGLGLNQPQPNAQGLPANPNAPLGSGVAPNPAANRGFGPNGGAGTIAPQPGLGQPGLGQPGVGQPGLGLPAPHDYPGNNVPMINGQPAMNPNFVAPAPVEPMIDVPLDVYLEETHTGRFMFGVGVNSDAGVTGQVVIDERNFDLFAVPRSLRDFANGTAFRGRGQGFRLEAMPGTQVQRYVLNFSEPYLFNSRVSFSMSAFYFDRNFFDWDERRLGGRVSFGYRLTPDLSVSMTLRGEQVEVLRPRVRGVPELEEALGENDLFSGRLTLTHDTRDVPFAPTEGHMIELSYEQAFGSFDYPRAQLDLRRYFLLRQRADGSGRHTLAFSTRFGFSGGQTPIYENFFAGGYSTMRGFDFRGASPTNLGVTVGGEFSFLGSVEYFFPITADDMVKGVVFCDFGTVEEKIEIQADDYRVAPGVGLRIAIPALGPAPLALDFAVPIARENTDDIQNFSFFIGFGR